MEKEPEAPTDDRFGSDYYHRVYDAQGVSPLDIHWWANRFYARLAERLLRRNGGRVILDVGCGQGFTLARLKPHVEAWGLEVSTFAASQCAVHAPLARVVIGNIEEAVPKSLPDRGFDVVLARYVLEHLRNPRVAMARCASLVRPGGYFVYAVPNMGSWGRRIKKDQWFANLDETHCSLLESDEWLRHTRAAGLEIDKVFSDGLWDVPYVKGIPKLIQYAVFSLPTIITVFLVLTILPVSWGENLIVIARKP